MCWLGRIFLLFLIMLSISFSVYPTLTQNQREAVPINESLRSVEGVYSIFPFTSCSLIPANYGGFSKCNDFVTDFCMENYFTIRQSVQSLSSDEMAEFRKAIEKIQIADNEISAMKSKLTTSLLNKNCSVYFKIAPLPSNILAVVLPNTINYLMAFSYADYVKSPIKLSENTVFTKAEIDCEDQIPIISDIADLLMDVAISFERYLERQQSAYENAGEAINILFDKVAMQADSLYYEGAGYSNYSTQAHKFYNEKIKSFIYKSKINQKELTDSDLNAKDFSAYFIYIRETSKKVSAERIKQLNDCEMGAMFSPRYIIAFNYLIDLHRKILENRAKLKADYDILLSEAEQKFRDAETRYNILMSEEYWKINAPIMLYSLNKSQETSLESAYMVPSDSIAEIKEYLYGSGSATSVKSLIDSAKRDADNRVMFYYAKGMEKFSNSISISNYLINNSYKIEKISDEVLQSLNEKVRTKLDLAYANLSKYPVYDTSSASAYDLLNSKYNQASSVYNNYNPGMTSKGERVVQLYNAARNLDEVIEAASAKASDFAEIKKKGLREALAELNSTISKAQLDKIDTTAELSLLNSKSLLLSMSINNVSLIDESIYAIRQAIEGIYLKAEISFSDIPALRGKTYSILSSLSKYTSTYQYGLRLDSIEKVCIVKDKLNPARCLGNYTALRSAYLSVLEELNKNASSILSVYLSNRYSSKTTFDSTPEVDSFLNMTTYLEINNDLSLGSSSQVAVQVRGIPFGLNSVVESEIPGIYAIKEKEYVTVYFPQVKENTSYLLKIKSNMKPATLVSREVKRQTLTNEKLTEQITYLIDSSYDIDSLLLKDSYFADSCSVFMNNRMQTVRSYSNLTIFLSSVKTGRQTIIATCTINNPITYTTSQYTSSDNKISYQLQLKSTYSDLNDVEYILEIIGPADQIQSDSIRVYDSNGQIPQRFQFYRSGDKYYAKWLIPLLSSQYINYTVTYMTTDIASYYSKLKSEIENISKSESIDVSLYLRDAEYRANRGKYDEAVNSLDKAKKEITKIQSQRAENASLTDRLNKISSQIASLRNKSKEIYSYSANLSLSDVSVEVAKQIAEFEATEATARTYLLKGDLANAKAVISQLEKLISSNKIDNAIYSKEKKIYDSLSQIERKVISIGKLTDVSELVAKLNEVKTQISIVGPATATQDYYSALLGLNNASSLLNEIDSELKDSSVKINAQLAIKLRNSKEILDLWKKRKSAFLTAFSIDKNSPVQLPQFVSEIIARINSTDMLASELGVIYSRINSYSLDEKLLNIDDFEELNDKTAKINDDIRYYDHITEEYKRSSAELIKDAGAVMDEKINKGTDLEKKRAVELQKTLSSAKESHLAGRYLNSMLLTQYIRDQFISLPQEQQGFDFTLLIYIAIVIITVLVLFYISSKREPPKIERKIEKIKLD
ncbi:MAG: hypothetical protein N3G74_02140 [Candidatus Micrarchaeota archaeon]|nr:hypothetical protein [Candidatus Micrarchaeota archaeon]